MSIISKAVRDYGGMILHAAVGGTWCEPGRKRTRRPRFPRACRRAAWDLRRGRRSYRERHAPQRGHISKGRPCDGGLPGLSCEAMAEQGRLRSPRFARLSAHFATYCNMERPFKITIPGNPASAGRRSRQGSRRSLPRTSRRISLAGGGFDPIDRILGVRAICQTYLQDTPRSRRCQTG